MEVIFQIREFHGFSIIARIWNPQKRFYEYPEVFEKEEEAKDLLYNIYKKPPSIKEIIDEWTFIGD